MASSNTANWSVYSPNGQANVEGGCCRDLKGPNISHLHWVPPEHTWLPQVISKADNYSSGMHWRIKVKSENYRQEDPSARAERGKVAFDWPHCPSLRLRGQARYRAPNCLTSKNHITSEVRRTGENRRSRYNGQDIKVFLSSLLPLANNE